jgi:hypothetical protein
MGLDTAVIIALITAIGAAISSVYATLVSRRKQDAEATARIVEATASLLDDLRNQIVDNRNDSQQRITILQTANDEQAQQIAILHETVTKALVRIDVLEVDNERLKEANRELVRKLDRYKMKVETLDEISKILSKAIITTQELTELLQQMLDLIVAANNSPQDDA